MLTLSLLFFPLYIHILNFSDRVPSSPKVLSTSGKGRTDLLEGLLQKVVPVHFHSTGRQTYNVCCQFSQDGQTLQDPRFGNQEQGCIARSQKKRLPGHRLPSVIKRETLLLYYRLPNDISYRIRKKILSEVQITYTVRINQRNQLIC